MRGMGKKIKFISVDILRLTVAENTLFRLKYIVQANIHCSG